MRPLCSLALVFCLVLPAMAQSDSKAEEQQQPDPAAQYKAIVDAFTEIRRAHSAKVRSAKTKEEKRKMFFTRPQPDQAAVQMLALAKKYPADAIAFKSLAWVARQRLHGAGLKYKQEALQLLAKGHIESPGLSSVCQSLGWGRDKASESLLRAALNKSPHQKVQALKRQSRSDPAKLNEATVLFERLVKDYPEQTSMVGQAKRNLHEVRNLIPGKKAPEVTGEDLDGKPLKLSDFLGKVVVFYFWGNW